MNYILQFIIMFVAIFEFFITLGFSLYIEGVADDSAAYLKAAIDSVIKLFENRNLPGKTLSCLIVIVLIPSISLILMIQMIYYIGRFLFFIWELGNKKD